MTRSDRTSRLTRIAAVGMLVVIFAAFGMFVPQVNENSLPTDPQPTCTVTSTAFASWFNSGTPAANGLVNPANSVMFPNSPNCSFYQWSEQMFLWLTSPVSGEQVFRTSTFFDVSPIDPITGSRTFIPHPSPAVLDVEQGQADNNVLEAQTTANGSLVYYMTTVNDVYAYLATGLKDNALSPVPSHFPVTASDLSQITTFAGSHGVTFTDPNALAIMVKSSWVLAAGLPNLSNYITTTATVETYDQSNPNQWVPTGQQTVQLALVGMHVVGSAAGHPEMIWATFEHMANAPRGEYTYINTSSNTVTVDQALGANWVFTSTNSTGPFNTAHMDLVANSPSQPNIDCIDFPSCLGSIAITPSDTIRWKAFGAASDGAPNPIDGSAAASNTEIISINDSVLGMLPGPDVRSNYVLSGAEWTELGAAPTGFFQSGGNVVGTSVLDNSTMETYNQGADNTLAHGTVRTCLTCHQTAGLFLSHDFFSLQPLTSFTSESLYTLAALAPNLFLDLSKPNGFVQTQISVIPQNGFQGNVIFSAKKLPKGVQAFFDPNPTATTTTLTLIPSTDTPVGVFTVEIQSSSGKLKSSNMVSLTATAQSFSLGASPNSLTIDPGSSGTSTITLFPVDGFSGDVTLAASGLPPGVTATFDPNPVPAASSSVLTLTAKPSAKADMKSVTIKGISSDPSGSLKATTKLSVTVE